MLLKKSLKKKGFKFLHDSRSYVPAGQQNGIFLFGNIQSNLTKLTEFCKLKVQKNIQKPKTHRNEVSIEYTAMEHIQK